MDHIPLPHDCCFPSIHVPYFDIFAFDNESCYGYPQRHGWQVEYSRERTLLLHGGEVAPAPETASLVQSWLYFGLLREILGDLSSTDQFIRCEADGKRRISTENLETLLQAWTSHFVAKFDDADATSSLDKLYKVLIDHRTMCLRIYSKGPDLGDPSIMISLAVLSERLMAALIDIYAFLKLETPVEQTWRLDEESLKGISRPILSLMQTRGWCPYDLSRLDVEIREISILYFYSMLNAPRSSKDHSVCSERRCLTMTTDSSTYSPSHRYQGCMCPMLFVDQEKVASILTAGSLPLILLTFDPLTQRSTITVEEAVKDEDFVAISHVWAEGSGNVSDNALHACLLEEISNLIAKLPWDTKQKNHAFWIDTLCVPVRPPELQILALNMMRVPYERARHVLVLDSHLRSLNSTRLSSTEVFAQVSCSSWMRRLWTLQEGRLAKRVWFQLADKAVDVQSIFSAIDHRRVPSRIEHWIDGALYIKLWMHIWYRGDYIKNTSAVTGMLSTTSLALSSRSVSVPTDEALCLVTLMGKDPRQVTAASPTQRMEVFWRTFDKVPKAFLFSKAPHKMTAKGLHWAPSSFMNFQSEKDWMGPRELSSPGEADVHAEPTSEGLLLALPGFALHQDLIQRMKEFDFTWKFDLIIEDQAGKWYALQLEQPWRHDSDITNISLTSHRLAVLLAHGLQGVNADNKYSHRRSDEIFFFQDSSVGVLVSIRESEDDIMYAHANNHVGIELLSEGLQTYFSSVKACAQAVDIPHAVLLKESHETLKTLYKIAAEKLLRDIDTRHNLIAKARHFGQEETYESILDDFLDAVVVAARFGDCAQAQKLKDRQLWCVD